MITAQPFEARGLPPLPESLDPILADLLTATHGFPHPGDGASAIIWAIRWLRAHPKQAEVLLAP